MEGEGVRMLPAEILELVFVRVPFPELFTTCRLVCRHWNQVITRTRVGRGCHAHLYVLRTP